MSARAASIWRPDDAALLAQLEDEAIFERMWRAVASGAKPPHRRAAGLVAALRGRDGGALEQAARGDVAPLLRLANQPDPKTLTPSLAHHLALFHGQLADVLGRATTAARQSSAEHPRVRAIAMWLWLAEERTYLERLAQAVAGGALSVSETKKIAAEAPYDAIARIGAQARTGAETLSESGRVALVVLARVGEAAAIAEVSDRVRAHAARVAAQQRETAIDDAIARVERALDEAAAHEANTGELATGFRDAAAIWRWSGQSEQVERFVVERVTPFAWERYRERDWDGLGALLEPIRAPVDSLAARIERDSTRLAYAAPCAQVFVFRAEIAPSFDAQVALAERALTLCPTHRNGRLVLADLLIERGIRALDAARPWNTGDALAAAAPDVKRAAALFPQLKRLPEVKERMKAMGRDIDD